MATATAARQATKPIVSICAPLLRVPHIHHRCHQPRRHGATRASAASSRAASSSPATKEVFTLSQIPQSAFESVIARSAHSFTRLSCAEYYAVAQRFEDAIRRGSNPWAVSFSSKDGISVETLHAVACIMRQIRSKPADAFAMAIWASASEMGHRPATLSLARQLIRSGAYGRVPQLRAVEARYRQLVGVARDADALTAEGELLYEQGRYDGAATLLRRALQIGGRGFEWRPHCELCLGKTYAKTGRVQEAREVFVRLADEGMVEADVELVHLLTREGFEGAEQSMYTAACNGRRDMFARLCEEELNKACGQRTDDQRRLWAMEWSRLADQRAAY
ncbi:hypothetical protein E4U41_004079 [Claviceps citrina]|nr:hypothetical protein E4U41_004079 [Claviceps citrina]